MGIHPRRGRGFWQEGTLLGIYQGEIREDGGVVFVKTTTNVGRARAA
jgi:hypothetical protein